MLLHVRLSSSMASGGSGSVHSRNLSVADLELRTRRAGKCAGNPAAHAQQYHPCAVHPAKPLRLTKEYTELLTLTKHVRWPDLQKFGSTFVLHKLEGRGETSPLPGACMKMGGSACRDWRTDTPRTRPFFNLFQNCRGHPGKCDPSLHPAIAELAVISLAPRSRGPPKAKVLSRLLQSPEICQGAVTSQLLLSV